ncbi:hypothetical protein Tsubulata_032721, partial [Turnera subulata]
YQTKKTKAVLSLPVKKGRQSSPLSLPYYLKYSNASPSSVAATTPVTPSTSSITLEPKEMERNTLQMASFLIIFLMASYYTPRMEVKAREMAGQVSPQVVTGSLVHGIACRINADCYYLCPRKCHDNTCLGGACFCQGCSH